MGSNRITYLDYAKALLIIATVLGHVYQDGYIIRCIYNFHMMAFFIISGIQFNYSKSLSKPMSEFVESRFFTMVIPFVFFEFWGCVTYLIRYGFHQNIKGFIYNTITLNLNNGVQWFLLTLIFAEIIFVATVKLVKNKWVHGTICLAFFALSLLIPATNNYLDYTSRILRAVFFLGCGYYAKDIANKTHNIVAIGCAAILGLLTYRYGKISFMEVTVQNFLIFLTGSLCGTYMIIHFSKIPKCKWLQIVGQNTLIVFATHNSYYLIFGNMLGVYDFTSTPIGKGLVILLLVAVAEILTVYLLNRFLPFFVGKYRPARKAA